MTTYKIIRFYQGDTRNPTVLRGLTLEEAQEHCSDPETSSSTATNRAATRRTKKNGPWFEGYMKE